MVVGADGGGWGFIFCQRAKRPPFPLTEMTKGSTKVLQQQTVKGEIEIELRLFRTA
jgi:hypothetical protein